MDREAPESQAQAGASSNPLTDDGDGDPDRSLDVSSDSFNPLLALYSPRTPIPFPGVRCFNNLAEYESFLRGGGRARGRAERASKPARKGRKPAPDPERVERLKRLIVAAPEDEDPKPPRRGRKPPKNVLTRMSLHGGGPLGVLHRCVEERLKVNVHIRTFKGLRGVCSGFVVAFDKFWNMAMVDVDETYRKPVLGKAFHNEPQLTLTRLFDKLKLQEAESSSSAESAARAPRAPPAGGRDHSRDPRGSTQPPSQGSTVKDEGQSGRTRRRKEKIDYQKVYTRHMKQVLIRGESVLLVHLPT